MIASAINLQDRSIDHHAPPAADGQARDPAIWLANAAAFRAAPVSLAQLPASLQPWLMLEDSMTEAIARQFGQPPLVAVHYSGADSLRAFECDCLAGQTSERRGYARHISLNIDGRPVLLARSVTYLGNSIEPLLSRLQTTPLARVLFEDDQWQRTGAPLPLEICATLPGRACVWQDQRSGERLVVEEFFNFAAAHPSEGHPPGKHAP